MVNFHLEEAVNSKKRKDCSTRNLYGELIRVVFVSAALHDLNVDQEGVDGYREDQVG